MHSKETRTDVFIENFVQDIFFYLFFLLFLSILRGAFLLTFKHALDPSTPVQDIWLTMWFGSRLSLKTVGAVTLVPFVFGTVLQTIWRPWPAMQIRKYWGLFCCLAFSILFQIRIPYYREFQNAFSPFIFNTFHDDVVAIIQTAIAQYQAIIRTFISLFMTAIAGGIGLLLLRASRVVAQPILRYPRKTVLAIVCGILVVPFAVFIRHGGAWSFQGSIYWKNSSRMNQHLLNEAILDDVQALYRARKLHNNLNKFSQEVSADEVRQAAARLTGRPYTQNSLLPLLTRTARGAKIQKPRHIFVIVAETYMQWPLLEKYKFLPVTEGMRRLIARPDSIYLDHFLSASNGTMFGLTSVLLGLPEFNLYISNRATAQKPYESALSVQLKKLGYKTRFFYGGFNSWENVGLFMKNQQFDEAYYYADFGGKGGVWGVEDKKLFEGIKSYIDEVPSFNYILTSSNHSPYTVDMTQEPDITSAEQLQKILPPNTADQEGMVERLQHFEYADKYLAEFVEDILQDYPDSLVVITGDHADRYTLTPNPSSYERLAVPLILIGKGLSKDMLPLNASGAHMDIVPTVMELILPKGATYYALGQDVLQGGRPGLHAWSYITDQVLGDLNSDQQELLPRATKKLSEKEMAALKMHIQDEQAVAAYRALRGLKLSPSSVKE